MTHTTMLDAFHTQVSERPDAVLFDLPDGRRISYAQTREIVQRVASTLREAGVVRGDRVAVQVEKSPEAIALYLAVLQRGAVFLPLNTAYTGAELDYFIDDARPRVLVCDPSAATDHAHRAQGDQLVVETLGTTGDGSLLEGSDRDADAEPVDASDPAAILYTSGTTGRSKGAVLTHANLTSNAQALVEEWRFTGEDRLIHALPIFHVHGLFVAVNMTLMTGATLLYLPRFDADRVIDLLPRASVLMGVPTFYTRLLEHPELTAERCAHMRLFVSGSAPLLARDHEAFAERTGHAILERYGMTETGMNASNPYVGQRKPGTVGPPLPGVEIKVADGETGAELPVGEVGSVEVRGPNVFSGYWQMPEKTASEFREDGFFITGDLGSLDEQGYLSISGRTKDLVISGGLNVYPKEIEILLDEHPQVLESAVIGVPHPDFGETLVAVVVPASGEQPEEGAVREFLSGRLAKFKQPRAVRVVDALPRNVMGKVQKAELRTRYADLFVGTDG
ncbi:malonate--CoA ligase [Janibacter sp. GS2]|uniref:malonate--CoA ligase n=1 Tax=Janibacter sp. GS2 TaxID=3442646 RepID=UPI003EBCD624